MFWLFFAQFGQASPVFPCVFPTFLTGLSCQALSLQASGGVGISTKILSPQKSSIPNAEGSERQDPHAPKAGSVFKNQNKWGWFGWAGAGGFALITGERDFASHKIAFAESPVRNYHKSQCAVKSSSFPPSCCHFLIYRAFPKNLAVVPAWQKCWRSSTSCLLSLYLAQWGKEPFFHVPLISFGKVLSLLVSFRIFFFPREWTLK